MISIVARLIACCAASYLAWRFLGLVGLVVTAPLFGVAFARPLIDALAAAYKHMRVRPFKAVQGRHFAYKGQSIDVLEDDEDCRWLRLADVRRVIPNFPKDEALRVILGPSVDTLGADKSLRVKAQALHAHLAKSTAPESVRFRVWLGRTVIHPSHK